jgi:hypothetical protein
MTIKKVSEEANKGADRIDFFLHLGNFLDEFYAASPEIRIKMVHEEPDDMMHPEFLAYLASASHKLANDCDFEPPAWVFQKRCYLPGSRPYFGANARGKLRLLFMYESPTEFKHRNLFVDESALSRV